MSKVKIRVIRQGRHWSVIAGRAAPIRFAYRIHAILHARERRRLIEQAGGRAVVMIVDTEETPHS